MNAAIWIDYKDKHNGFRSLNFALNLTTDISFKNTPIHGVILASAQPNMAASLNFGDQFRC